MLAKAKQQSSKSLYNDPQAHWLHQGPTISWHLNATGSQPRDYGIQLALMNYNIVQSESASHSA